MSGPPPPKIVAVHMKKKTATRTTSAPVHLEQVPMKTPPVGLRVAKSSPNNYCTRVGGKYMQSSPAQIKVTQSTTKNQPKFKPVIRDRSASLIRSVGSPVKLPTLNTTQIQHNLEFQEEIAKAILVRRVQRRHSSRSSGKVNPVILTPSRSFRSRVGSYSKFFPSSMKKAFKQSVLVKSPKRSSFRKRLSSYGSLRCSVRKVFGSKVKRSPVSHSKENLWVDYVKKTPINNNNIQRKTPPPTPTEGSVGPHKLSNGGKGRLRVMFRRAVRRASAACWKYTGSPHVNTTQ